MKGLKVIRENLQVKVEESDVVFSMPVWRNIKGERTLGVKLTFANMETKKKVYKARTKLKNSEYTMSEDLTKRNQELAFLARKAKWDKKVFKTWTEEGTVYFKKTEDSQPVKVLHRGVLDDL